MGVSKLTKYYGGGGGATDYVAFFNILISEENNCAAGAMKKISLFRFDYFCRDRVIILLGFSDFQHLYVKIILYKTCVKFVRN